MQKEEICYHAGIETKCQCICEGHLIDCSLTYGSTRCSVRRSSPMDHKKTATGLDWDWKRPDLQSQSFNFLRMKTAKRRVSMIWLRPI